MTATVAIVLAVFGASCVECIEALTLVLAAGTTRGWRSALEGAGAALVTLGFVVGAVGVPLVHYVPIGALRVVVGALLLVLGLSWLHKAILRASGHRARHDEDAVFAETTAALAPPAGAVRARRDGLAFAVAFKGVLLEGLEVVLIVVSAGASEHRLATAALAAGAAVVVVGGAGALLARQLSSVPENAIKSVVGVMLTSFGVFWVGEGAGVSWPGADLSLLWLIALFALVGTGAAAWLRTPPRHEPTSRRDPVPS